MMSFITYLAARVQKKMRLSAVKQSKIDKTSKIEPGTQAVCVTMARHSFIGHDCFVHNASVGAFCSIGDRVTIGGVGHPMHFVSTSPVFLSHRDSVKRKFSRHVYNDTARTRIGNDVWIGQGAMIRAGVTVGDGAVVGMGAVVSRDVRPYAVVVGNPAKEVRRRFDDETCNQLLLSAWWDYGDANLTEAARTFSDVTAFLRSKGLR